ncbi:hypothetical protein D3C76_1462630 [compost metagenome]
MAVMVSPFKVLITRASNRGSYRKMPPVVITRLMLGPVIVFSMSMKRTGVEFRLDAS